MTVEPMLPKTKRIFLAIAGVLVFYCILFTLPKVSFGWSSVVGIGTTIDCECLGLTRELEWIGGAVTYCYGIPYSCEYNLLYAVPFLWFAVYSLVIAFALATLFVKEQLDRKRLVLSVFAWIGLWLVLRILLASYALIIKSAPTGPGGVWEVFWYILLQPLNTLFDTITGITILF